MDIDSRDIGIIERLEEDGRSSLRNLAEDMGISPSTISNRFHNLEEEGVIRGFGPDIDYEKVGFDITAVIEVTVDSENIGAVAESLEDKDGITSIYVVTGNTDIILVCKFIDRRDMYGFLKDLQKEDGIGETKTKVVLDAPKENGEIKFEKLK